MKIGFHTDAFNTAYFSFEKCLEWAKKNDVRYIECGLIDGVSWIHGLGYQPHVALYEDPLLLKKKMDGYSVGEPDRLPLRRYDRRDAQTRRAYRRRGHDDDENQLRTDHRGRRGA